MTVIPGNHDAYVRATRHHFAKTFGDYLRGDAGGEDASFPFLRRRGPLALIGVSSAVPTPPLMATGRLGRAQLDALERILAQLSAEDAFRVLLVHHPLHSGSRVKRLTDSRKLRALLQQYGVELVLHGHDHIHSTMWFEGPSGKIPAIGVPSASALARRHYPGAAYNLFSIERDGGNGAASRSCGGLAMTEPLKSSGTPNYRNAAAAEGQRLRRLANSARPNSASAPRMKPSTNIPNRPRAAASRQAAARPSALPPSHARARSCGARHNR